MSGSGIAEGYIEVCAQGEGVLLLGGWLRAAPQVFQPGVARLWLKAEGQPDICWQLRYFKDRPDLAARDDLPEGRGFRLLIPNAKPLVSASASISFGETMVPLRPGRLQPVPFVPLGHLGQANRSGVAGWVLDRHDRTPMLLVDERIAVPVTLDQHRPDLPFDNGRELPRFGFKLSLRVLGEAVRAVDPRVNLMDNAKHSITLLAGGVEIGHRVLQVARNMEGKLERVQPGEAGGWAGEADPGGDTPMVDLLLGGTRWESAPATTPREDLVAAGIGQRLTGGAFRVALPRFNPEGGGLLSVELRPGQAPQPLGGTDSLAGLPSWQPNHRGLLATLPAGGMARVAIIVPIHNAVDDLAACIGALVRHTTGAARLILIDDASTDPAVSRVLNALEGRSGIEVHRNATNLGFTATVKLGLELAGTDDVVLLNSDTLVGPGWLEGLWIAAYSSPRIGTVTAVSNNAGAFSVPEFNIDNALPGWLGPTDMARLVRHSALALWPSVPTGNGFCLYIRRTCIAAIGSFDTTAFPLGYGEENDFCMRAGRAGFENLVDDRTYVWHRRSASFGQSRFALMEAGRAVLASRYPEYASMVRMFRTDPAFLAMRWRVRRALMNAWEMAAAPRPRMLFVISTESGGTPQTNGDLMKALADRYEPWVLRSDGQDVVLSRHGITEPVECHRLTRPMEPATHRSAEYDGIVADLLLRHGFELVHIRHLAWHGIGLPAVCRTLGVPVVLSFHDFYMVCPTVKLLDAEQRFCGGRCTMGTADCTAELWPAGSMPPLRHRFVHRWRAMMAEALSHCDAFVTTSPFARETLLGTFPILVERGLRLIPHGRSFTGMASLAAEVTLDEPLRVLVPGNISSAKGAALVAAIAALDLEREVEFHILGAVDQVLAVPRPGVILHGRYERDQFAAHVLAIQPHIGAVLSIWPETYCHTLTECWAVGLPVLGVALGAIGERIGADGGGWLIERDAEPAEILARLLELKRDRNGMRARRDQVLDWQQRIGRHYDATAMAVSYDLLYREIMERRRCFGAPAKSRRPVVLVMEQPGSMAPLRLPLPLANTVDRPVLMRMVAPSFPFGDPGAGPADAVLLPAGAVRPRQVPELLARCAAAGLPVVVEVDEATAALLDTGDPKAEAAWTLVRAASGVLAGNGQAAALLQAAGVTATRLPLLLDALSWVRPAATPSPEFRVLAFDDDPDLAALKPAFEDLAALGIARLVTMKSGRASSQESLLAAFRDQAETCRLAVLPGCSGLSEHRALLCARAGLVVLRGQCRGEPVGETAAGALVLSDAPLAWVRAITELMVDPQRRDTLRRRGLRYALTHTRQAGQAWELDTFLRRVLAANTPQG